MSCALRCTRYTPRCAERMSVMACRLVINNIKDLDPNRKCFRLIGGVLVERTVKDVLPAITKNVEKVISKASLLGRAHPLFTGAGYRRYKRSSFSYQIPSVRRRRLRQVFSKSTICSSTRERDRYGVISCKCFLLLLRFRTCLRSRTFLMPNALAAMLHPCAKLADGTPE